jgi:hypothetical protein
MRDPVYVYGPRHVAQALGVTRERLTWLCVEGFVNGCKRDLATGEYWFCESWHLRRGISRYGPARRGVRGASPVAPGHGGDFRQLNRDIAGHWSSWL